MIRGGPTSGAQKWTCSRCPGWRGCPGRSTWACAGGHPACLLPQWPCSPAESPGTWLNTEGRAGTPGLGSQRNLSGRTLKPWSCWQAPCCTLWQNTQLGWREGCRVVEAHRTSSGMIVIARVFTSVDTHTLSLSDFGAIPSTSVGLSLLMSKMRIDLDQHFPKRMWRDL